MVALSARALRTCRALPLVRPACPRRIPQSEDYTAREIVRSPQRTFESFELAHGAEYGNPARDRPPRFLHVVIEAGELGEAFDTFSYPSSGKSVKPRDGLLTSMLRRRLEGEHVPRALFLESARWRGKTGTVVLVPAYEFVDSLHAGHLVFRWREHGNGYVVSLHAWEPFSEAFAGLRAMIRSIPPAPARA
jgi:hypothetical protein